MEVKEKVFPITTKQIEEARQHISIKYGSDSDDSDEEGGDNADNDEPYNGTAFICLNNIECKIGNRIYRYHIGKGFKEC